MTTTVHRYLPDAGEQSLDDLYTDLEVPAGGSRPHVYLDMVASADGAATLDGRSGGLGGAADRRAFLALRETCDAILTGAGTVRAEDYGPPSPDDGAQARRQARGLEAVPRLVIVTASLDLDPDARVFGGPPPVPIVATTLDAPQQRAAALDGAAEILRAGQATVDLPAILDGLHQRGVRRLLCEGGPTLNGHLLEAGLVDELFLTIAPQLAFGGGPRIVRPPAGLEPRELTLTGVRRCGGELLLRYRVG